MALVDALVAILGAAFAGRAIRTPYADGDLFWQKHLGAYVLAHHVLPHALGAETFTAAGAPWTPQEWLLGVLASVAIAHGALWVLGLAAGAAVALALGLTARRAAAASASAVATAVCMVLLAIDLQGAFGIRAQVLAWPLFCALLLVLDGRGRRVLFAWPLVALWANLHASVMLALPIVWIDAIVALRRGGWHDREARIRTLLAATVPLAILATPLGIRLPLYAAALLTSPIRGSIDEWQPLALRHDFFWIGAAPMLAIVLLCVRPLLRERPRDLVWLALLAAMTAAAIRNAPLLGFVAAPLAARGIELLLARAPWWHGDPPAARFPRWTVWGAGVPVAAALFAVTLRLPPWPPVWKPPVATIAQIAALPGEHRLLCYDFTVCSVALDYPNLRVFIDGRADPYPVAVWEDFDRIRRVAPGWRERLDAYRVDAVVVKRDGILDRAMATQRVWTPLPQEDACCRAYSRMVVQTWRSVGGRP